MCRCFFSYDDTGIRKTLDNVLPNASLSISVRLIVSANNALYDVDTDTDAANGRQSGAVRAGCA